MKYSKHSLPDPEEKEIKVYADTGELIGTLIFEGKSGAMTSKLQYADGQLPHRSYPLRKKHRN